MTAILGGGLAGLTAAYYALRSPALAPLTLFEASNRLGGWIRSKKLPDGTVFEQGPRTVKLQTKGSKNTLTLLEEINLAEKIIAMGRTHPASTRRLIYANNELHLFPTSFLSMITPHPLLQWPLLMYIIKEYFTKKTNVEDESVYHFIQRRFGKCIADNIMGPVVAGVFAGDAKKISIRAFLETAFKAEQEHGSVIKGILKDGKKIIQAEAKSATEGTASETSDLLKQAKREGWTCFTLEGGLEQIPSTLTEHIKNNGVGVQTENQCEKIQFQADHVELTVNGKTKQFSRVISATPAKNLAPLIREQHPDLSKELEAIPSVTVAVVNLQFPRDVIDKQSFGFLVRPLDNEPILGVIFDSCLLPAHSGSVLTVMMGGAWFEKHFGKSPSKERLLEIALSKVHSILKFEDEPTASHVSILKDCIPQHVVGHAQRLNRIRNYIAEHRIPLALCGASYQGVGVNDVILSAKEAVSEIVRYESS